MRYRTMKQMKRMDKVVFTFTGIFMVGMICWTATALEEWWSVCAVVTIIGLVGTIVSDVISTSIEKDIAELLREEKRRERERDEAA